jgi:phospholipid/cholesterol/gamma-HCH transport system permease protein
LTSAAEGTSKPSENVGAAGAVRVRREAARLVIVASGAWVNETAGELDRTLRKIEPRDARAIVLDLAEINRLDTAGAWLLVRTRNALSSGGAAVELANLGAAFAPLLGHIGRSEALPALPTVNPPPYRFGDYTARVGRATVHILEIAGRLLGFVGLVCVVGLRTLRHPGRFRFTALLVHMERAGLDAVPIVGLLCFLIGVVMAFQGADQLGRFGAEIYTVNLLGIGILRELGVLIAAIIVAGRSGSAFTAQIGTMQVNEEIDAMIVLGLDPVELLVLPRFFALLITLPLVVFFANAMALLGGALMCWSYLGITIPSFLRQLQSSLYAWTFWIGVLKAPFFAGIIALTGCYEGLRVTRSAESVGRLTTRSVVESIFLVILADALFTIIFTYLRI